MLQTFSRPIRSTRLLLVAIVTPILISDASPTAAQLRLVDLAIDDVFLSAGLDFVPTFPEQADFEMTSPTSPLGTTDLIEVTVQDGDLNSTGARSNARAGFTTITTNAQFVVDGGLPAGSARSAASVVFDVINATETPHEVFLDFFLPPALLEFSDNVESAGHAAIDNIEAFVSARLCRDECSTTSSGDALYFEFEATLSELYVPADTDAARIDYDLLVDVSASNPQLNLEPLLRARRPASRTRSFYWSWALAQIAEPCRKNP